ncbi:hypothetical protein [Cohnella caldifontis]|uniref:hypothetical protein n=1 Tax=Cohnella caldifontis TaxID=3027471 RepID=UPI0023EBAC67|nr:hypothetical protein [Cohnella sp. YIM B05605]
MNAAAAWQVIRLKFAIADDGKAIPRFPPEVFGPLKKSGCIYRLKLVGADHPSIYTVVSAADWVEERLAQEELEWEFEVSGRCDPDEIFAYLYSV